MQFVEASTGIEEVAIFCRKWLYYWSIYPTFPIYHIHYHLLATIVVSINVS